MSVRPPPRSRQSDPTRRPEGSAPPRAQPTAQTASAAASSGTRPHRDDGFDAKPRASQASQAAPAAAQAVGERNESSTRPLRVIITGYGDFAGVYKEAEGRPNPSGVLARQLAQMGLENAQVEFRHLEVTHGAVEAFMAEVRDNPPDIILSMGVSSKAQVEERPENWKSDAIDGQGNRITPGPISEREAPRERLATDLPVDAIERALRQAQAGGELTARTVGTDDRSRTGRDEEYFPDASAYLCNYLNFRLTETFDQNENVTAGFVHVTAQTTPAEMRVIAQALVDHEAKRRQEAAVSQS